MAGSVQLSVDDKVVRVHAARHDPAKDRGAFAMPKGEPRKAEPSVAGSECRPPTGTRVLCGYRELTERFIHAEIPRPQACGMFGTPFARRPRLLKEVRIIQ